MARIISNTVICAIVSVVLLSWAPCALAEGNGTVVLDAGHGGYDTGLITSGVKEKDVTLEIVKALKSMLEDEDRKVWLTRKIDQFASIEERRSEAVKAEANLFISLHMSESDTLAIYLTWYLKDDKNLSIPEYYNISSAQRRYLYESKALSRSLGRALAGALGLKVEYRSMPLELINSVAAPAVMIELPSQGVDYTVRMPDVLEALRSGIEEYEQR